MAPIPIYSQSPITANAPTAVTPQTDDAAAAANRRGAQPPPPPATTTATAGNYAPPLAQPGAVPHLPQPTGAATQQSLYGQRYGLPLPTPTTTAAGPPDGGPPPPQPGAVPYPPGAAVPVQTSEPSQYWHFGGAAATAPPTTAMPPQMAMPPLSQGQAPSYQYAQPRGTATATAPQQPPYAYQGGASYEQPFQAYGYGVSSVTEQGCHPPGYVQTAFANTDNTDGSGRAAAASRPPVLYPDDGEGEGIWSATKKLAAAAGSKLSVAESGVWKLINGKE